MAGQQPDQVPGHEPRTPAGEPAPPPAVIEEGGLVDPRFLSPGPGDIVSTPGRLLEPGVGPPPEGGPGKKT